MKVDVECRQCGKSVKAPATAAGKTGKCPGCGAKVKVPLPGAQFAVAESKPLPSPWDIEPPPPKRVQPLRRSGPSREVNLPEVEQDLAYIIASSVAGVALLLLSLSPLFNWVAFGSGGMSGLKGDGQYVLAFSVGSLVAVGVAALTRKAFYVLMLGAQGWSSIAVLWIGALIWKINTIVGAEELASNPFAALLATQVGPGTGLYLGLIGGLLAAGALGFLMVRLLREAGKLPRYYITQGVALVLGVLIAVIVGPGMGESPAAGSRPSLSAVTSPEPEDLPEEDPQSDPVQLKPVLLDRRFYDGDYEDFILLDIRWEADSLPKPARAVKGVLHFTDLFGETKMSIQMTLDEPITPGESFVQKGKGFEYNQFKDSHDWVRYTAKKNMRLRFEPLAVIYEDGTRRGF